MILNCLMVGLGGALGSIFRYLVSQIPSGVLGDFPLGTFLVNFFGAIFIGFIVAWVGKNVNLNPNIILFLKVGFCGGFTTFSTFSLETAGFFQSGNYTMAALYIILSLVLCVSGVFLGMGAAKVNF